MAAGDITIYDEALEKLFDGTHQIGTHVFKCAVLDNTNGTLAASDATPTLADYTQVGAAGTYTTGGDTVTLSMSEAGGTLTIDMTDVSWAQDASNDTDARWFLIYNDTAASDDAIAFVDLGAAQDMSAGDLDGTVNASGLITAAQA